MNVAYNMDCMEYMRSLPDKAFDLAVVDPPYGGGATAQERERESCTAAEQNAMRAATAPALVGDFGPIISATRTGGKWARKYQRERPGRWISVIGILHRRLNTSKSWPASAKIRLFGAVIISPCRLRAASLYGVS